MELSHSEHHEQGPERDPRLERLTVLAVELDFVETDTLRELHVATVRALVADRAAGVEAMTAFQIAAAAHIKTTPDTSNASIGYQVTVGQIWLEGGEVDLGLDQLWETAYQAGQTPGIETLRETLEAFVANY